MEYLSIDSPIITWFLPVLILIIGTDARKAVLTLFGSIKQLRGHVTPAEVLGTLSGLLGLIWLMSAGAAAVFTIGTTDAGRLAHHIALLVLYASVASIYIVARMLKLRRI